MSLPEFLYKKLVLLVLGMVLLFLYVGFNIWLFQQNSSGFFSKKPSGGLTTQVAGPTPTPTPFLPTPTPRPTGPGKYACDPSGVCNEYGDEKRTTCPTTFADRLCLDQCGDTAKRCSQ